MLIILIAQAGLFREGVARLVCDFDPGAEVRCADYWTSAVERGTSPDLLMVDGDHQSEALDALSWLGRIFPHRPALALLTEIDQPTIRAQRYGVTFATARST